MSAIDKVIEFFSPSWAAERARSRLLLESIEHLSRSYDAATRGRRGKGWNPINEDDANLDNMGSLVLLRQRSRNLFKNNPYARKAARTIALGIVGTGIQPVFKAATKRNIQRAKKAWDAWAVSKECDFYGRKNLYALQMQAVKTLVISGEVLVLRRRVSDPNATVPFKIQLLGPEFLDHTKGSLTTDRYKKDNFIVQGVEFDPEGRRVAYWIYDRAPSNTNAMRLSSMRYEAEDVLHVFDEEHLGQVRGVPFLVAAMLRFKDFDDYEDAQLIRQKLAACFTAFVTTAPSVLPGGAVKDSDEELARMEPGLIQRLQPGESVTLASPPGTEGYDVYSRKIQQGMAAASGITYEQLTGDLSGVNFSSGRMGWIEAQRQIEDWQFNLFIPDFCDGVVEWFSQGLEAKGAITERISAEWTPRGRFMIDPAKEMQGISAALGAGLTSWSEEVRAQGYDPDTLLEQIKADIDKLKALGIPFEWLYGKASRGNNPDNNPDPQN